MITNPPCCCDKDAPKIKLQWETSSKLWIAGEPGDWGDWFGTFSADIESEIGTGEFTVFQNDGTEDPPYPHDAIIYASKVRIRLLHAPTGSCNLRVNGTILYQDLGGVLTTTAPTGEMAWDSPDSPRCLPSGLDFSNPGTWIISPSDESWIEIAPAGNGTVRQIIWDIDTSIP